MNDLAVRTQRFALSLLRAADVLPRRESVRIVSRQLMRSATSVAANYRAAQCARSPAEFYAKLCIVEEEADETVYWIEMLNGLVPATPEWEALDDEAHQLVAIVASCRKKAKARMQR